MRCPLAFDYSSVFSGGVVVGGAAVGSAVGFAVGSAVGFAVGSAVGFAVGSEAGFVVEGLGPLVAGDFDVGDAAVGGDVVDGASPLAKTFMVTVNLVLSSLHLTVIFALPLPTIVT